VNRAVRAHSRCAGEAGDFTTAVAVVNAGDHLRADRDREVDKRSAFLGWHDAMIALPVFCQRFELKVYIKLIY
jgi:hypothetical protein